MSFYCPNTILFLKIDLCTKNIRSGYMVWFFFSFFAVNFCEASTCTVSISENFIKTLTFDRIIVGKYGNSKQKCEPDTLNGMCSFPFTSTSQK